MWGTGATDRGNDVWVTGRSHGFYRKQHTPEGDQEVNIYTVGNCNYTGTSLNDTNGL